MRIEKTTSIIIEIIAIILAIKIFSFILAPLSWALLKNQICDIISLWNRWDAPHYIDLAKNGYTNVGEGRYFIVFMPLYPFLIKLRPSYTIYMLFTWLIVTSTGYWLSIPRYTLSMFPIFIVLAIIGDKWEALHYVMTIAFLLFYSFCLVLFTQGYWAF